MLAIRAPPGAMPPTLSLAGDRSLLLPLQLGSRNHPEWKGQRAEAPNPPDSTSAPLG